MSVFIFCATQMNLNLLLLLLVYLVPFIYSTSKKKFTELGSELELFKKHKDKQIIIWNR